MHPNEAGRYDFILCADVLEHIALPVQRALDQTCRLLKPHGFLGVTIFCNASDAMREHFPELNEYRVVPLGRTPVLINRRKDGVLEIHEDELIFHGGHGATLEMREFGTTALKAKLLATGFSDVHFPAENIAEIGILFDGDVSQPLIVRKAPFAMEPAARGQLLELWQAALGQAFLEKERADAAETRLRLASRSRRLRLGRKVGLGPKLGLGIRGSCKTCGVAMKKHNYTVNLQWTGNRGSGTSAYSAFSRDHEISGPNKQTILQGSSDPGFRGDRSRYNPEELLVASLSSCHMLWVLHLCADSKVVVLEYRDDALGEMMETEDGSGRFTRVVLRPKMRIAAGSSPADALEAHRTAHHKCFIANSVNFEVAVEPDIAIVDAESQR